LGEENSKNKIYNSGNWKFLMKLKDDAETD